MRWILMIAMLMGNMLYGYTKDDVIQEYIESMKNENFDLARIHLQNWENIAFEDGPLIRACEALIDLVEGQEAIFLDKFPHILNELISYGYTKEQVLSIFSVLPIEIYQKLMHTSCSIEARIFLCKAKKKGWLFKYVLGGAEIVAGCLVSVVSPGLGATLIGAGVTTCVSAMAQGMDEKTQEDWDREAREKKQQEEEFRNTSFVVPALNRNKPIILCAI